jgi:ATP-binding cassette subfamily B (MDR/TAP) protein 1
MVIWMVLGQSQCKSLLRFCQPLLTSLSLRVLFSVNFAASSIGRLVGPIMMMLRAASAAAEIFVTLDTPVPDMSGLTDPDVSANEDIEFKDVDFHYPTRVDAKILKQLCLTFKAGQTTAIVGPSGSGKSTIVGLIQRWYEPIKEPVKESATDEEKMEANDDSGVFVGSTNLNKIDVKWWRTNTGLVQQEPFLFNDTIFNNVANGLCGTKWNESPNEEKLEMVKNACQESFAAEFIDKLPEGYQTMVGESGIKLSGGQRQRLAIARAIIKQPSVLILDEATSAIDVRTERIVQKALDRVSEGRTTITIAHRLSTIKRADKIIVLRAGQVVEQGTHNELLQNEEGVYSGLVKAQQLEMGNDDFETGIQQDDQEQIQRVETENDRQSEIVQQEKAFKERGVVRSFGFLMWEQRYRWFLYLVAGIACSAIGASYPLQSYLFAHLVQVFTLTGPELVSKGNFWALMFFILACGVGFCYWVMGFAFHLISHAVSTNYRQEFLNNTLAKRTSWYDKEGRSPGTLTSELSTNATQLQELLGTNMGIACISVFNLVGSIIISFYFGWKLALVGVLTCMPVVLTAGFYRIKLERGFEKLNAAVFAESSQFGSEAVAAYRTVTSLMMEDKIVHRFDVLLKEHVKEAFRRARYMTLIFAFSDSADMFCQALVFYYGGSLLAKHEYAIVSYFVIYMSAIQAAQAAGSWFSFAPK